MTVETRGLVATDSRDIFAICKAIEYGLRDYGVKSIDWSFNPGSEYAVAIFVDPNQGELPGAAKGRKLMVHFLAESDSVEGVDRAIVWTLNLWGNAHDLIKAAGKHLPQFGNVYFLADDIGDSDWQPMPESAA